jgi:hypothetical protein
MIWKWRNRARGGLGATSQVVPDEMIERGCRLSDVEHMRKKPIDSLAVVLLPS